MISIDTYITEFITNNYITITLILGILKSIAIETSWAGDDKIVQIITGMFNKRKRG